MKRLFTLFFLWTSISFACDVCNLTTGLLTTDPVNWAAFEQRQVFGSGDFNNDLKHRGGDEGSSSEIFNNSDVTVRYFFKKQFFFRSTLGWNYNFVNINGNKTWVSGLADPQVLLGYQYIYMGEKGFIMSLEPMFGANLPIGAFKDYPEAEYSPGSRAWGIVSGLQSIFKKGSFGGVFNVSYAYNRPNPWGYWYGDVMNIEGGLLLNLVERDNFILATILGLRYEKDYSDGEDGIYVFNSKSDYFSWQPQLVVNWKSGLQIQTGYQGQLLAEFPGWDNPKVNGWSLSVMYSF
jgi:hypothetical protein